MDYWLLWGKTRQGEGMGDETHALMHHLLEVGAVAAALWDLVVAEALRADLCRATGLEGDEMRQFLAWLASLHDVGKASPAFQARYPPAIPALQAAGLRVPPQGSTPAHHTAVSHTVLLEELPRLLGAPPRVARRLAAVIGGHHGVWQSTPPDIPHWELGDDAWAAARRAMLDDLTALYGNPRPERWPGEERELNPFLATLAGLLTMADWLGSMGEVFPCRHGPSHLQAYLAAGHRRAAEAVERLLPGRLPAGGDAPLFARMFPSFTPNAVQQAAIELADQLEGPALVIIEAPTGCGKTEAALYLAEHLREQERGAGTYVAMPTMTTSNQMHGRVARALAAAHPGLALRPLLVHGQALWQAPAPLMAAEEGGEAAAVDPMAWFLPRKRSLLAPYGVGTVDQALLSVLPATHFYLRLYGLARKTVVFDEVHAYDTYMSTLFERLLAWLQALGSSAVILSATLPSATRQRLLAAYGPPEGAPPSEAAGYPAINWRSGGQGGSVPLAAGGEGREIELRWLAREAVVDDLRAALAGGGCAAVICNTVARAQATYLALKEAGLVLPRDLYLFHARFPQQWRDGIEGAVLGRFGKERRRRAGERAIVVATQVVEQSLDLDFDYMLSDLAPVDLLIQRAGRLHRHPREETERPARLARPALTIVRGGEAGPVPRVDDDGPMYEPYVLLRTLLALEGRQLLHLPADTSELIAAVYDAQPLAEGRPEVAEALAQARVDMERAMRGEAEEARVRLVAGPESRYFVGGQGEALHDEDPAVHRSLQALTRLAEPSVQVVCLHRHGEQLSTAPEGGPWLDPERLDDDTARALARSSVSVSHRGVVFALLAQAAPAGWARHPFLRHCRLAVFDAGRWPVPGTAYSLRLSRDLGLQVTKEEA